MGQYVSVNEFVVRKLGEAILSHLKDRVSISLKKDKENHAYNLMD